MLRTALALRSFGVVQEALHSLQASGVEGFEDVQRGEEKRAGTAGGVQDRDSGVAAFLVAVECVPEGTQQLRPLALGDDIHRKSLNVQVQGDEVIYILHIARRESDPHLFVSLTAGHDLTPGLCGQRVVVRRRGVPAAALGYVVDARGDVFGQVEGRF